MVEWRRSLLPGETAVVTPNHTRCRICRTALSPPFFDLGLMPLANAFLSSPEECAAEPSYPLAVCACPRCGLVQLNHVVPAEQLYRHYLYVSSTSDGVRAHAAALAKQLIARYGWGPSHLIVEVASNDGTVLKAFQTCGVRVLGIEPAENIAALAETDGVPTLADFFNAATARAVRGAHGEASAVIGRHVFAHVDDVHDFLDGVRHVLGPEGVFIIEVPYLGDLLARREFDTIYHEHLSYVALAPMEELCRQHGLQLMHVDRIGLHGGSIILHMARAERRLAPSETLTRLLAEERTHPLADPRRLAAFARDVQDWKERFIVLLAELQRVGGTLVGYGAAAKANTLLNYCPEAARMLQCVLDRSPHKQGRYTPGTHLRVDPVEHWRATGASHLLILAWNFAEEIMRQMRPFAEAGGRFVIPIPEPRVV